MRKRFEEELSKLAFGDLDAEEARRLSMRAMNDPEASQTFQTYCRMKEELRSLGENVPADQLSKERLREAILSRGMKDQAPQANPKPTWIWMPAMAAVLAFGVMFVKGQMPFGAKPNTVVVDNSTSNAGVKLPNLDVPQITDIAPKVALKRKPVLVEKSTMTVAANVGNSSRRSRASDVQANRGAEMTLTMSEFEFPKASEEDGKKDALSQPLSFDDDKKGISARDMATPAPMSLTYGSTAGGRGGPASAPTIIVIQSETDADTGTLKAKEVSGTANVIVGG